MDLNEFMGDDASSATTDTAATAMIEVPSNLDFVVAASFSKLLYTNMEMTNVSGTVKVKDAKATMENVKMNLLDGAMIVDGSYDTKNIKKPLMDFDLNISDFDLTKT